MPRVDVAGDDDVADETALIGFPGAENTRRSASRSRPRTSPLTTGPASIAARSRPPSRGRQCRGDGSRSRGHPRVRLSGRRRARPRLRSRSRPRWLRVAAHGERGAGSRPAARRHLALREPPGSGWRRRRRRSLPSTSSSEGGRARGSSLVVVKTSRRPASITGSEPGAPGGGHRREWIPRRRPRRARERSRARAQGQASYP